VFATLRPCLLDAPTTVISGLLFDDMTFPEALGYAGLFARNSRKRSE
jgi:hypothetical protein